MSRTARHEGVTFRNSVSDTRPLSAKELPMIGLVRAVTICAALAFGLVSAQAADKAFKRDDLANRRSSWKPRSRARPGPVAKAAATLRTDADAAFRRTTSAPACRSSGRSPPQPRTTAATGCGSPGPSSRSLGQIERADLPAGARLDRGLYRLSARRQCRPRRRTRWPCSAGRCPSASCGVRRSIACGCRSTCAKSPRCAANTRSCATSTASGCWTTPSIPTRASPRACFQFSEELAKRTDFAPFLALAGTDKPALIGQGQAALRRGPQARRALQHQSARRPAVHGEGDAAEIGRVQHLCPRPQAVRALHRARLCAAAHRPARHSAWSASTPRR